ncbi:MAG: MFS transporter [Coriobacteriales bacterium]|jgi:MFS family permease|nr:MFS transporter [Coriobacteriales bacterium]
MGVVKTTRQKGWVKVDRYAWVILGVVLLASISPTMNFLKPPGIASTLIPYFGIGVDQFGWMMSIFSLMGVVFALPAGLIMHRLGVKKVVLMSVGSCLVGALIGAFSTNFGVMLFSRFLEGIGESLVFVAAPTAIFAWFPQERQGFALGVWSICMPFGSFVMLNTSPHLTAAFGWRSVWLMGAALAAVAFVLYAIFFRMPEKSASAEGAVIMEQSTTARPTLRDLFGVLRHKGIWFAGIIFGCYNFVVPSVVGTYYPYFLETQGGIANAVASSVSSIPEIIGIIGGPFVGLAADRLGLRKALLVSGCFALAIVGTAVFMATSLGWAIVLMCLLGIFAPFVTTGVRLVIPEIVGSDHLKGGMGNAVLSFCQNLAGLIGPIIAAAVVLHMGWAQIGYALILPIFAIAVAFSLFIKSR